MALFKLQHNSDKFVHPFGGGAVPSNDTNLVLFDGDFSTVGGGDALTFRAEPHGNDGKFKLVHWSGKYVHPFEGCLIPNSDTPLVLYDGSESGSGGEQALLFRFEDCGDGRRRLVHNSGLYVHPLDGADNPGNDTKLVLHASKTGASNREETLYFTAVYR
eukprot:TRINITY_DN935_c7_g1_i1.p2 TRINITY_DN935_c7_g1~~TRINITY_DN935_c7_g1_i1.p2  ORF type:complete len:160 (+),score=22.10 TRINITY_DN935_c7_g1_i1:106-585(+)